MTSEGYKECYVTYSLSEFTVEKDVGFESTSQVNLGYIWVEMFSHLGVWKRIGAIGSDILSGEVFRCNFERRASIDCAAFFSNRKNGSPPENQTTNPIVPTTPFLYPLRLHPSTAGGVRGLELGVRA